MRQVMVDIETLAQTTKAAITNIGGYAFDFETNPATISHERLMYIKLDWGSQDRLLDQGAVKFWLQQPDETRRELLDPPRVPLKTALLKVRDFVRGCPVWANGVTFDLTILEDAYQQLGMGVPWKFRQMMCMRSIRKLAEHAGLRDLKEEAKRIINDSPILAGQKHNALYDAVYQAVCVQLFYRELKHGRS